MAQGEFGIASISPTTAYAGQKGRWDITYTAGPTGILQGGSLRVFGSQFGYDRWTLGKVLAFCDDPDVHLEVKTENTDPPSFHYWHYAAATITVYGKDLSPGQTIRVTLGAIGGYMSGRRVQAQAQAHCGKTRFNVLVDPKGNGQQFSRDGTRRHPYHVCDGDLDIEVKPGLPAALRLTVRSAPKPGADLVGVIAVEDEYHNPIDEDDVRIHVYSEEGDATPPDHVVRQAGKAGVKFNIKPATKGIAYVGSSNWERGIYGVSNPVSQDFFGDGYQVYFGDMHVMSGSSGIPSMLGTTDSAICYARDVFGLDFTSVTNSYNPRTWADDVATFKKHNRDHEFVALPSLEVGFRTGHKNVFFLEDDQPAVDPTSAENLFKSLEGRNCTVIPHHPNIHAETDPDEWGTHDLSTINPKFERHIEISQSRGSFEHDDVGDEVSFGGFGSSARDVLALGHRLGFVGGTDTHRAQPGLADTNLGGLDARANINGGITGVLAKELTRKAIFEALLARRCYATTSVRMLLDFSLNDQPMGTDVDLTAGDRDGYAKRTIKVKAAGDGLLDRIVIVRNGVEVHEESVAGMAANFTWADYTPLEEVTDETIRGVYYYAKVYQKDGNLGWASPIWLTMGDA